MVISPMIREHQSVGIGTSDFLLSYDPNSFQSPVSISVRPVYGLAEFDVTVDLDSFAM